MNNYKFIESRARNRAIDTRNELGINLGEPIDVDILKVLRKKKRKLHLLTPIQKSFLIT